MGKGEWARVNGRGDVVKGKWTGGLGQKHMGKRGWARANGQGLMGDGRWVKTHRQRGNV